jgi:hypothetical protein
MNTVELFERVRQLDDVTLVYVLLALTTNYSEGESNRRRQRIRPAGDPGGDSSRARCGSGRRSTCAGRTSMPRDSGFGCHARQPSATVRSGSTCPSGSCRRIEPTCPLEDRIPERKVFQGISEASAYQAMARACRNAKVPHYHPHDVRHRRITIWHQSGVPARELAERAGQCRPCRSTSTRTACRSLRSRQSGSCPTSHDERGSARLST